MSLMRNRVGWEVGHRHAEKLEDRLLTQLGRRAKTKVWFNVLREFLLNPVDAVHEIVIEQINQEGDIS